MKKTKEKTPVMENFPSQRKGSKGGYVTLIQTNLQNRGYDIGQEGVDGLFGPKTEAALKEFQRDVDLPMNGVVGPKMWKVLQENHSTRISLKNGSTNHQHAIRNENIKRETQGTTSSPYAILIEGLTRYQAELMAKIFNEGARCKVLEPGK